MVVKADFGVDGCGCVDPVHGGFHFATVWSVASFGFYIIGAVDFCDIAICILDDVVALNKVGPA